MPSASDYVSSCDGGCVANALDMARCGAVCPFIVRSSYGCHDVENLSARFDALSDSIKVAEKRMVEVQALQQHIKNYRNTRQIYIEYRKSGYSKKFFEEHRQEITIHKAAKQAFDELQITKLPSMQSLYEEFHQLAVQKKQDYAEYRQIRKEKEELLIAKRTVETILNIDRQKEQEKEKEKEEKKNFR